ncbi:MAG TPA: hypothetical protein VGE52_13655 [Pirellulales bacterium]
MSRAWMLPVAWCSLPLAALLSGCTGAVSPPGASQHGARPTVDSSEEPTTSLYATSDSVANRISATSDGTNASSVASTTEGSADPAGTATVSPSATAGTSATGDPAIASDSPVGTGDSNAKPFQTPATDAAAATILKAPRPATPPKPLTAQEKAERAAQPVLDLTFDDLKFDIEKDAKFDWSMTTEKMESLRGRRIRIRGWIHPSSAFSSQVRDFIFVRDNLECCFGPGAAVFDCLSVAMAPGKSAKFGVLPIAVEGTLELDPFDIDGVTRMLYRLDGAVTR